MSKLDLTNKENKQGYTLYIPFKFISYGILELNENPKKFILNKRNYTLKFNEEDDYYYLLIKSFNSREEAKNFYEQFKFFLRIITLKMPELIFEYQNYISEDEEDFTQINDGKYYFYADKTVLIPKNLIPCYMISGKMNFHSSITFERIEKLLKESLDKIHYNPKIHQILDIYSKCNQYTPKNKFINLFTIIEMLFDEDKEVPEINKRIIDNISNSIKELRNNADNENINENEKKEYKKIYNDYNSIICSWKNNYSKRELLKLLSKKYENKINIDDCEKKLNNAYNLRNKIVHANKYQEDEKFYESLKFLDEFIKQVLILKVENTKN